MSLQVENLEKNMAKLTVELTPEELEGALQKAYLKNKKQISIPGFRKGKVPRQMVEKMYGPEIFYEDAADDLGPGAYDAAVKESGLEIVSRPDISVVQIEKGKPFIFEALVAVKPAAVLGQYKGIEVEKIDCTATEDEVNAEIEKERENNSRAVTVEDRPVQDQDMIVLDFDGSVDGVPFEGGKGENYPLTIGSGSFIPGFEDQLIGAEIGKELEVDVTFPENYQAKELQGKDAVFKCVVKEIRYKELPEVDDDFAQDVSEFDTLEEYKADIKKNLEEKKAEDAKARIEDAVVEKIVADAQMEIPDPMIDLQAERLTERFAQGLAMQGMQFEQYIQYFGMTTQNVIDQYKPQALRNIQSRLVLEAVAAAEGLEASEEEIEEEYGKMAEKYGMELDKFKEELTEEDIKGVKEDLAVRKAVDFVREAAVEVEKLEEEAPKDDADKEEFDVGEAVEADGEGEA